MHLKAFIFLEKNGSDFDIGQTDPDDLKKHSYGCSQVFTQAETCVERF